MTLLEQMQNALKEQKEALNDPYCSGLKSFINGRISELNYWIEIIKTHENLQIN